MILSNLELSDFFFEMLGKMATRNFHSSIPANLPEVYLFVAPIIYLGGRQTKLRFGSICLFLYNCSSYP